MISLMVALQAAIALSGCVGWGDMFQAHRVLSGGYFLQKFEDGQIYLMVRGESGDVAGPIDRIGWSSSFIVLSTTVSQRKWTIIDVKEHKMLRGGDRDLAEPSLLKSIQPVPVDEAWKRASSSRN